MENIHYVRELEEGRQKIYCSKRMCLIPDCTKYAIKNSHVLQRKRILEKIVDATNKFYVLEKTSLFNKEHRGLLIIKKMGIKEACIFPGFCQSCDRDFFSEIENNKLIFQSRRLKSLFAYRTLCLELRRKEIYLELVQLIKATRKKHFPLVTNYFDLGPAELAISDLKFFKAELESELFEDKKRFNHFYLKLPERQLCFSTVVSIFDQNNPLTFEYDKYGYTRTKPIVISVLNYFPYENNSYLLASFHTKYPCKWTTNLLSKIKANETYADKEISDIVTYRSDFWAISPDIFESWSEEKIKEFKEETDLNADNYSFEIKSKFSIWE
ncbi:hypothetical protein HUW51_08940 [Adhaeribacter swui]|uniref:Uncharacterized protein n=1 Tax=Adhaeribacter swui TaxID=2086471 RepID=A0A7G7G6R7_9BACT|nr:hypothetical protein [Adhaeribacter swui]QNF32851.1 hypothetical protein HUW51_08940 [Adhaeribacter swui]